MAEFARDAEARRLACFLEEPLWLDVALHWHAPPQQCAGPSSRSYRDDSLGVWSGLHCTLAAPLDEPLFLDPERARRADHPSALLQNALVAILPFHLSPDARRLVTARAWPSLVRLVTHGEACHENPAGGGFDDAVYPGGWSELTSWQTAEFALGSATRPYVNGGHADAVVARIRRAERLASCRDFRSVFARGGCDDAAVGRPHRVHVTGGATDARFLYQEGRTLEHQHRGAALVLYALKIAGAGPFHPFRVGVLFSHDAPLDRFECDGAPVAPGGPGLPAGRPLVRRDFRTFGLLLPLVPAPAAGPQPVRVTEAGGRLAVSILNPDGLPVAPGSDARRDWRNGFYLELRVAAELPQFAAFAAYAAAIRVTDEPVGRGRRRTVVTRPDGVTLGALADFVTEEFIERAVDGAPVAVEHFEAVAGPDRSPLVPHGTL